MHQKVDANAMFGLKDAQRILKIDHHTLHDLVISGKLPAIKVGKRWQISGKNLACWLARREHSTGPESQFKANYQPTNTRENDMLRDWT